jgi:hypothetical protein
LCSYFCVRNIYDFCAKAKKKVSRKNKKFLQAKKKFIPFVGGEGWWQWGRE